jgi:hypothetical protein
LRHAADLDFHPRTYPDIPPTAAFAASGLQCLLFVNGVEIWVTSRDTLTGETHRHPCHLVGAGARWLEVDSLACFPIRISGGSH